MTAPRPITFGMVGGGTGAFIGAVHRTAIRMDGLGATIAGALSSTPERSLQSGKELGLAEDRTYPSWQAMLAAELDRTPQPTTDEEPNPAARIDAVSIVTPNHLHVPVAKAFLEAGIHVVCDKPLATSASEARTLAAAAAKSDATLTVTYNYSGYPLVREARALVAAGELGTVRKVVVEYFQGWLSDPIEKTGQKQASWRVDPKLAGAGALGDIGTHAFQLAEFITGEVPSEVLADVASVVEGRPIDDDASVFLRYASGARGTIGASQVAWGEENNLTIRVYGDKGALKWAQETPNELHLRTKEGTVRTLTRGVGMHDASATAGVRVPPGHPEGYIEAFANIYRGAMDRIRGVESAHAEVAPGIGDGVRGNAFIDAALSSAESGCVWTPLDAG